MGDLPSRIFTGDEENSQHLIDSQRSSESSEENPQHLSVDRLNKKKLSVTSTEISLIGDNELRVTLLEDYYVDEEERHDVNGESIRALSTAAS